MEAEKAYDLQAQDPGKLVQGQEKMRCATSLNPGKGMELLCLHLLLYLGCEQMAEAHPHWEGQSALLCPQFKC